MQTAYPTIDRVTMLKPYSPKLVNWSNDWDNSFGFQIDKPNLYTGAYTSVMTYDDCLFLFLELSNDKNFYWNFGNRR